MTVICLLIELDREPNLKAGQQALAQLEHYKLLVSQTESLLYNVCSEYITVSYLLCINRHRWIVVSRSAIRAIY